MHTITAIFKPGQSMVVGNRLKGLTERLVSARGVRAAHLRKEFFILDQTSSIGDQSGEWQDIVNARRRVHGFLDSRYFMSGEIIYDDEISRGQHGD